MNRRRETIYDKLEAIPDGESPLSRLPSDQRSLTSIAVSLKRIADQGDVEHVEHKLEPPPHAWQLGDRATRRKTDQGDVIAWIKAAGLAELAEVAFAVKDRTEALRRQP